MGYHTDFNGSFNLDKPLTAAQVNYLKKFAETRRVKRDISKLSMPTEDMTHIKVGLPNKDEYFVDCLGFMGQDKDDSILDYNSPPAGQPGLWCQWVPTDDGESIVWDEGEKFYNYVEWIEYIIENFLKPWGYVLNGEVSWNGEEQGDVGIIVVENNEVRTKQGRIVYDD